MRLITPLLVTAAFAGVSEAVLDNYYLFNGGDAYWINKLRDISVPNRWVVKRPWGTAPRHCVATAIDNNYCNPTDLEIYDIYYADCHAPWTVCRCNSVPSTYSIDVIADNIGKVPVRARSWVRHYSFYPANNAGLGAYSTGTDINVFGDFAVSTILFHETSHNLDYWYLGGATGFYSNGAEWQNLASKDSCVPTQYSKASWQEDFAEMSVQAIYEENFGGIPIGTECMANTLTKARSLLRSAIKIIPGDLCIERITPSTDICMGASARAAGACNDVLDLNQVSKREDHERRAPAADGITYWDAGMADHLPVMEREAKAQQEFDARLARADMIAGQTRSGKVFEA
ncbi:hypothetical protein GQ53DRAFT_838418 [Thozetella sp. PMI_491]|nr:hypothetical protein GQ53DRAFT_838418 [Thozetella sp. PMI_491]